MGINNVSGHMSDTIRHDTCRMQPFPCQVTEELGSVDIDIFAMQCVDKYSSE